jgi:excisionase family DNA binding protein
MSSADNAHDAQPDTQSSTRRRSAAFNARVAVAHESPNLQEKPWGPAEAADFLGVRPKTVRAMARARTIPAAKVGRQWRFNATTLRSWFKARTEDNVQDSQRPSLNVKAPRIGKSSSRSLAAELDGLLEQRTSSPHKS